VEHLWLIVLSLPSADEQMRLREDLMHATVEFYERARSASTTTMDEEEDAAEGCSWEGDSDDAW
jgi:hypothetical protein